MPYLSKKNVKWNSESVSMFANPAADCTQVQKTVVKSAPHSENLVGSCPAVSVASSSTTPTEYATLPSLAPLANQEVEVGVLANIPQPATVDMTAIFGQREQDRKVRREIANSNERRRMQSINAGFKALKTILPQTAGEKLSKAAILQQTAEYILQLNSIKTKLLKLNEKYRSALTECKCDNAKRSALLNEGLDKDEGIGSPREEEIEDFHRDSVEIRLKLDKERRTRIELEEKIREMETKCRLHHDISMTDSRPHLVIKPKSSSEVNSTTLPRIVPNRVKTEVTDNVYLDKAIPASVSEMTHQAASNLTSSAHINLPSATFYPYPAQDAKPTTTTNNKHTAGLPRSRQPLKKRAVEIVDIDSPKNKISKVQINTSVASSIVNISSPPQVGISSPSAPKAAVLVQQTGSSVLAVTDPAQGSMPVTLQPSSIGRIPQEKLVPTAGILNIRPQINLPEQSLLLSATSSAAPTYITLSPASAVFSAAPVTWPESQVTLAAPNYSFAINPSNPPATPHPQSQYVIQPTSMPRVQGGLSEEMTLNQLNSVPSLSMTLTQLNAVPTMARLNSNLPPGGAALPTTRIQTHYLPVVAMDTVLDHQADRRMSNATTDSAPSDEETKSVDDQNLLKFTPNLPPAPSRRTKSDPGVALPELQHKEVILCNPSAPVLTHATLTTVTNGPGSPLYRQIDAAATRRNLETIVQAIDHLEQQERRNSQDQQTSNR